MACARSPARYGRAKARASRRMASTRRASNSHWCSRNLRAVRLSASNKKRTGKPKPELTAEQKGNLTLLEFFRQVYLLEKPLTPTSATHFECSLLKLNEWAGHTVRLNQLNCDEVSQFVKDTESWTYQGKPISPKTRLGYRDDVLCLWRAAFRHGYIDVEPRFVRKVHVPRPMPTCYTVDEMKRLIKCAERLEFVGTQGRLQGTDGGGQEQWRFLPMPGQETGRVQICGELQGATVLLFRSLAWRVAARGLRTSLVPARAGVPWPHRARRVGL